MTYGAILSFRPFSKIARNEYWEQVRQARQLAPGQQHVQRLQVSHIYPMVPIPSEKLPVTMSFMLCISVGLAVLGLGAFHLYLILTAQTTIEFHGTCTDHPLFFLICDTHNAP
jgi:hypothetical protein